MRVKGTNADRFRVVGYPALTMLTQQRYATSINGTTPPLGIFLTLKIADERRTGDRAGNFQE